MASIQEKKKNNKIISYKFVCCLGRNVGGGQICRSITWHIPEGMSQSKMRKAAEQAAEIWEEEVRKEFEKDLQNPERAAIKEIANAKTNFCDFVMNVWFPIYVHLLRLRQRKASAQQNRSFQIKFFKKGGENPAFFVFYKNLPFKSFKKSPIMLKC